VDLKETTIAQRLKSAGYATGIVGKWHLGDGPEYLPIARGFDFSIGSVDNLGAEGGKSGFYRGKELLETLPGAPITTPLYAAEAIKFIDSHQRDPFFLYLAFNAIHTPHVASEAVLKRFKHLPQREQAYAAIIAEADDAIGLVMTKLRDLGLEEETLVFCIADNGGAAGFPEFGGLRGAKWLLWEGGIREPWIVQWKGHIPGGRVVQEPVIQLDVMPTALAAAGAEAKPEWQLDGKNLLPLLEGTAKQLDRKALFWRFGVQFAVRQGDWKLVKAAKDMKPMLVNLAADLGESRDLSLEQPEKAQSLLALWEQWNSQMQPPRWEDRRWDGQEARQARKQKDKGKKKAK
jgi:arylsulfatase A-like enzyme